MNKQLVDIKFQFTGNRFFFLFHYCKLFIILQVKINVFSI